MALGVNQPLNYTKTRPCNDKFSSHSYCLCSIYSATARQTSLLKAVTTFSLFTNATLKLLTCRAGLRIVHELYPSLDPFTFSCR